MVLDPALREMMQQTIQVATRRATSQNGDGLYNEAVEMLARVEPSNQFIKTSASGEDITANWHVFTAEPLRITDKVYMPGFDAIEEEPEGRIPKVVAPVIDEFGEVVHYEAYI